MTPTAPHFTQKKRLKQGAWLMNNTIVGSERQCSGTTTWL